MKQLTGILAVLTVILFISGYWICEYFHEENMIKWRELRDGLKNLNMFLIVALHFSEKTPLMKGAFTALLVLLLFDQLDRYVFDTTVFVYSDYILLVMAGIVGIKTYRSNVKRAV